MRVERIADDVTLYLGDCRDILPILPRPAAIVSDPPYGQRQKTNVRTGGSSSRHGAFLPQQAEVRQCGGGLHRTGFAMEWPEGIVGDDAPFDPARLLAAADIVLLWGAHRFHERLPAGTWLIWDKVPTGKIRDQGDGEAAWLNGSPRPMRIHRLLWDGVCVGSAARHEVTAGRKRVHPAQKPEALMAWCIAQARVPTAGSVYDPYMGAGATGVASVRAGHPFVGIEIEPVYFDTACRRLAEAVERRDAG